MNFNKVSEGLIDTIEKLSENKKDEETVTEKRRKQQEGLEVALGEEAPKQKKPKKQKPVGDATPAVTKTESTQEVYPHVIGQTATEETFKTLKDSPQKRKEYLDSIRGQKGRDY